MRHEGSFDPLRYFTVKFRTFSTDFAYFGFNDN